MHLGALLIWLLLLLVLLLLRLRLTPSLVCQRRLKLRLQTGECSFQASQLCLAAGSCVAVGASGIGKAGGRLGRSSCWCGCRGWP